MKKRAISHSGGVKMDTTLVIMAAGIGSRYGAGIKQLAAVDPKGHILIDYSIYDAIEAGFSKLVFIIRKDIEDDFREVIGDRIETVCAARDVKVAYCFQSLEDIPGKIPEGRSKPWGTGQAVLAARNEIDSPFAVINADDFYGSAAFFALHDWLEKEHRDDEYSMAGFILKNTLSDNGGVTRGVCKVDGNGFLTGIAETPNIVKTTDGAESGGIAIDPESYASMNMWGLPAAFIETLDVNFKRFFKEKVPENPLKVEYLLPILIGELLERKECTVEVLPTADKWLGITYASDLPYVKEELAKTRSVIDWD